MPKHAVVINVGRGLLSQKRSLRSLSQGVIAGAGLDVLPEELLPADSRLWDLPNLILSPHNSGYTPYHADRALEIFLDNWQSFIRVGRPHRNVIDPENGIKKPCFCRAHVHVYEAQSLLHSPFWQDGVSALRLSLM